MARVGPYVQEKAEERRASGLHAREILETVILTALIFLAVHFSIQPYKVDGPSMQPGLHTSDFLIANLWTYRFSAPRRGDVVILHPPATYNSPDDTCQGDQCNFVKRIVGVPGDILVLTPNSVSVDGQALREPYINSPAPGEDNNVGCLDFSATDQVRVVLGKDQYYVMGDNRRNSEDSRCFGPITRDHLIGKAEVVLLPLDQLHWLPDESSVFAGVHQ